MDRSLSDPEANIILAVMRKIHPGCELDAPPRRLAGGSNQQTIAITAKSGDRVEDVVLKRQLGPRDVDRPSVEAEAEVIRAVGLHGVPVPQILHVLRPEDRLGEGYLMSRVYGEGLATRILRDERFDDVRPRLARQCGEILARIHGTPRSVLPILRKSTPAEEVQRWHTLYRSYKRRIPVFEFAFRWLFDNILDEAIELSLVHGDFRNGNFLVDEQGIAAVIDWENAFLGDPAEDLAWLCINSWRFGNIDLPVGGFGTLPSLLVAYEGCGGIKIGSERLHFWSVFGSLKWGLGCIRMIEKFESGADRSIERLAIGRRASETELDLLRLLAPRRRD